MATSRAMRLYLRVLYILGILCAHLDKDKCLLQTTPLSERYALMSTLTIFVTILGCFVYACSYPENMYISVYNKTGNTYEQHNLLRFCVVLCLLHIGFYIRRRRHKALVQSLLQISRLCSSAQNERYFLKIFITYIILFVIVFINYANGFAVSGLSTLPMLILVIVYSYAFLDMCLIIVFFVCLQHIIAAGLAHNNLKLLESGSRTNLRRILYKRQRLLYLDTLELNKFYGPLMMLIVPLFLLLAPSGPLYLISTAMDGKLVGVYRYAIVSLTAGCYNIPWLIMMSFVMSSNVITVEANKTAKILAKIPRTGSGLDKMVEKFLLKNLRQQPILTAYGFFALDKSTLFKLFTAIFTYMVILVQFKEMENSTKYLQKTQLNLNNT